MVIENNKMVSIHYTLTDVDGKQLDTSIGGDPLSYIHGKGYLIPGLEKALEGKNPGEKFSVTIQPEDGYGVRDDRLIATLPKERFEIDGDIEVGMQFQVATPAGPTVVKVIEVTGDSVKIDGNHDLAGKVLNFDIEITDVRNLTEEEFAQLLTSSSCGGGCGGCGGDCGEDCNCEGDCNDGEGCGNCNCNS